MRVLCNVLACFLVLGLAAVPMAAQDDLMQEVEALSDKVEKALVENDTEFLFGLYAEDAISLPNFEARVDGIEALKQHHEEMTAAGVEILAFESEPTDVWAAGDQVIEIGTFEIELKVPEMAEPVEDRGNYLTVYERDGEGKLKIKAEIWNTSVNPMEMMGHEINEHEADHEHEEHQDPKHDHGEEGEPEGR